MHVFMRLAKPQNFTELVKVLGLIHGTGEWSDDPRFIRDIECELGQLPTTREDIMNYLTANGINEERSFSIMENVRKGKGLNDSEKAELKNIPDWFIEFCDNTDYLFPKAHVTELLLAYMNIAWFKINNPVAYYTAYYLLRADEVDGEIIADEGNLKTAIKEIEAHEENETISPKEEYTLPILKAFERMYSEGISFSDIEKCKHGY